MLLFSGTTCPTLSRSTYIRLPQHRAPIRMLMMAQRLHVWRCWPSHRLKRSTARRTTRGSKPG
jgi:hypothetical protein